MINASADFVLFCSLFAWLGCAGKSSGTEQPESGRGGGNQRDPDFGAVVCKDDRDCPGPYAAGRCRPLTAGMLPYGLKLCAEP